MEPYRTAEVRWFRPGEIPAAVRAWFDGLASSSPDGAGPEAEPQSRIDRYLAPASAALGVKLREGQIEAKRRDGVLAPLAVGRSEGPVEFWTKWSFPLAEPVGAALAGSADLSVVPGEGAEGAGDWVAVQKTRWQRHADGCALELSRVATGGEPWWSVCLEATGAADGARRAALAEAAEDWLGTDEAPALAAADAQGYPAWLLARRP